MQGLLKAIRTDTFDMLVRDVAALTYAVGGTVSAKWENNSKVKTYRKEVTVHKTFIYTTTESASVYRTRHSSIRLVYP